MNRFKMLLLCSAGVALLAVSLPTLQPQPAGAQAPKPTQPVQVMNTPLPVHGTATITGAVGITGTPNVAIANPPTAPALIRDVDSYGKVPFQRYGNCQSTPPESACWQYPLAEEASASRPRRAVIEHVSVSVSVPAGGHAGCELRASWPDDIGVEQLTFDWFPLTRTHSNGTLDFFGASHQAHLYHLGDSNHRLLIVCACSNCSTLGIGAGYTVSGYFW